MAPVYTPWGSQLTFNDASSKRVPLYASRSGTNVHGAAY